VLILNHEVTDVDLTLSDPAGQRGSDGREFQVEPGSFMSREGRFQRRFGFRQFVLHSFIFFL